MYELERNSLKLELSEMEREYEAIQNPLMPRHFPKMTLNDVIRRINYLQTELNTLDEASPR